MTQTLPRVDALGSRQFLLDLLPELCDVPSAIRPLRPTHPAPPSPKRFRALDVGAGIGRVTADVLLHLVSDVVLLEPVRAFIDEARRRCQGTSTSDESSVAGWSGIRDGAKSVSFLRAPLQDFDPARPGRSTEALGRLGYVPAEDDVDSGFDVIWCQWCLGHLNDRDLVAFLKRSAAALRGPTSLVVVKENMCSEKNGARTVFDEEDSSWTRYVCKAHAPDADPHGSIGPILHSRRFSRMQGCTLSDKRSSVVFLQDCIQLKCMLQTTLSVGDLLIERPTGMHYVQSRDPAVVSM